MQASLPIYARKSLSLVSSERGWYGSTDAPAAQARAVLSQRSGVLDDVETMAGYAPDPSMFLNESELTERRALIKTFVK